MNIRVSILMAVVVAMGLTAGAQTSVLTGKIGMSGAWALYPMAVKWGEEFKKLHPKVELDISAGGAGKGITDALSGSVDIGLVSRDVSAVEIANGAVPFAVTKDAVVPMINAQNPFIKDLIKTGVKKETFAGIWIDVSITSWNRVADKAGKTVPIHVYTRSDACGAAETWAKYLGGKQENLKGIGVYGDPGIGEAVRKQRLGVGYNNVNFAYDANTDKPVAGLAVLPIDINGNGTLDSEENFYGTRRELLDAIASGAYPSPPARELFFVLKGKPSSPLVKEFVHWVLTDGQKFVDESGYIVLPQSRLNEALKQLE